MKSTQISFAIDRNDKTLNKKINQLEDFGWNILFSKSNRLRPNSEVSYFQKLNRLHPKYAFNLFRDFGITLGFCSSWSL